MCVYFQPHLKDIGNSGRSRLPTCKLMPCLRMLAVVKTFEETFEETLVNEDLETGSFAFDVLRQLRVGKLSRNLETCQCIVCRVLYTNSIQINLITPA